MNDWKDPWCSSCDSRHTAAVRAHVRELYEQMIHEMVERGMVEIYEYLASQ